ncbi:MAG: hypothetical protein KatS3mg095_0010 [Candidatus Parcubacteria bacterium]|nr:MAG: hypothetical protein KatS3mg095_0010 [Candidatus Parcubacteria bacterium]
MEFLKRGQATLVFIILIFLLSFSILVLMALILVKENNFSKLTIANIQMFYGQLSILNMALQEVFINNYLPETYKSFNYEQIISFFYLPEITPEINIISGNLISKSKNYPLEWRFNFQIEKNDQNLEKLRIYIPY